LREIICEYNREEAVITDGNERIHRKYPVDSPEPYAIPTTDYK
jgi:hypothetical protein